MKDDDKWKIFYYFGLLGQLGFVTVANVLLAVFIYKFIEKYVGQNTFLFIFFLILGILSGFYSAYALIYKKK